MIISLVVSMAAALFGGVIKKHFTIRFTDSALERNIYNAVLSVAASIVLFLWGGAGHVSLFTIALGIAFGIATALQQISTLKAMESGPWSYTTLITSLSMLIPTLSGVLVFNEQLHWAQVVGIFLMCICFVLSIDFKVGNKKASLQWFLYCMAGFAFTGAIGVMQKLHQNSEYKSELNAFLIISFIVSFLYSCISAMLIIRKERNLGKPELTKFVWIAAMVAGGGCLAVNNKLNLYLSGVMDSAVFFPLVNGGGLVLTVVTALFVFKERLTVKQWIGVAVGIVAVIFLCNPFAG